MKPALLLTSALLFALGCGDTVQPGSEPGAGTNNGATNNGATNNGATNNGATNNGATNNGTANNGEACTDHYQDRDGDGFGGDDEEAQCIEPDADPGDLVPANGDCGPDDPLRYPNASGVCGDHVDDNCDGSDEACPESQPSAMNVPDWDCTGDPPDNVAAWAFFESGEGYFQDGGCFVFFEGLEGEYYVQRRLERTNDDPSCETRNGCVCPSLNGWPSYDRRLYAFTLADDREECPEISILDHGGEEQPVSNSCRKYLYQLHFYDLPFSYVTTGYDALDERLSLFPKVEVACARDAPHANLPFTTLVVSEIQRNEGHRP